MSTITTEQVKELRDATGVSVMQCRKALEEAEGDMDKAMIILQKKGAEIAGKKADRDASDGLVVVRTDGKRAITLIMNCETDFVAKNDDFVKLANTLADKAWESGEAAAREAAPDMINDVVLKIGENIKLGDINEVSGETLGVYTHHTGKTATIVILKGGTPEIAKDIAMHTAAMKPKYVHTTDINEDDRTQVMEVLKSEMDAIDKPEEMKAKIMEGKIAAYFKEQTLDEQPFFKVPEKTIKQYAADTGAVVDRFVTYTI